jgi:YfiH family protein
MVEGNRRLDLNGLTCFSPLGPLGGIGQVLFTTRMGGASRAPYDSLNLALHVGDVEERVRLSRRAIRARLPRKLLEPVVADQVHGTRVRSVGPLHAGTRWEQKEKALADTDSLATDTAYLPLVALVADCLGIAIVDPVTQVGAVVHAGWRGMAAGVIEATAEHLYKTWGSRAQDLAVWAGACIGPCCYEVGPEVAEQFPGHVRPADGDRSLLDLRGALVTRLRRLGVWEENCTGLALCTSCHPELFFSHRRSVQSGQQATGRQALLLWLEPQRPL